MLPTPGKQPTPGRAVPKPSATPPPSLPLPTPASPTQAASRGRSAEACVGCARDVRGNRVDGMCVGCARAVPAPFPPRAVPAWGSAPTQLRGLRGPPCSQGHPTLPTSPRKPRVSPRWGGDGIAPGPPRYLLPAHHGVFLLIPITPAMSRAGEWLRNRFKILRRRGRSIVEFSSV